MSDYPEGAHSDLETRQVYFPIIYQGKWGYAPLFLGLFLVATGLAVLG